MAGSVESPLMEMATPAPVHRSIWLVVILLKKGMTGQGYLDDKGNWLEGDTLTGVDAEEEVPTFHKSISGPQTGEAGSIYAAGDFG